LKIFNSSGGEVQAVVTEGGTMKHYIVGMSTRTGTNKRGENFTHLELHTQYKLKKVDGYAVKHMDFWNDEAKALIAEGVALEKCVEVDRDDEGRVIEASVVDVDVEIF
jgi:hypothetical protein